MAQLRLRIVGECVIEVGGKRITPTSPQLFALLLFLGIEHDREVSRAELIELLYPASDPLVESSHRLRQLLYKLRGMGVALILRDGAVRLEAKCVNSDLEAFLGGSWETRRDRLIRSVEVLPHYSPPYNTILSEWVERLREQMHHALRQQLTRDMEVARRKVDLRHLEAIARRTLELDPLNESAVLALAEVTARTGSKARAVSILDAYRSELGEERANLALPASLLAKRITASREHTHSALREPIPFTGRERDLGSLLAQWQSARRGNAHLIWLTGNKSVGKSRLAEELANSALISGSGHVVSFAMSPMDADRPLSLVAALANRLSSLPGAAGCNPSSFEALGKLLGSIDVPVRINPDSRNSTYSDLVVRDALCDLVACVTDDNPLLVVVDDAQHLDDASNALLDAILRRVFNKRLLIVLCSHTDLSLRSEHVSTFHVEPLSPNASQELWRWLVSAYDTPLQDAISQRCLDSAGGNPGYLELLAQQAVQDGDRFLIPSDLIALTDRRLSQLSLQARYALEATVVLEDVATASSIAYLTGLAPFELLTAFHALESGDLIVTSPSGVRCRSGLIAERVRVTSLGTIATVLEGRAAEYLEKEQTGERWSPSTAWRIASHWQRAGEPRRARAYLRACWQHAVSVGQPTKASSAINDALRTASDPEDRASLLDDLIGSLQAAGDDRALSSTVRERRLLSSRVHDSASRAAQLAFDEDEANWNRNSNPALSVDSFREHLESSALNTERRIRSARLLMMTADGELDGSLASYTMQLCQELTPEDAHSALLLDYVTLIYHTIFGDADLALRIADKIQTETKTLERSWNTLNFERNCAFARQLVGVEEIDYQAFERGFAQALDASMLSVALWFAGSLMSVLVDEGDLDGADKWMHTAERLAESFAPEDWPIDYLGAQIDLALLSGRYKKATRYLDAIKSCSRPRSRRVDNDLHIYSLRVRQFSGNQWDPKTHLPELLQYHELGKRLSRHDEHMEVLWQTLNALGEPQRASELLADYLRNHRRERRQCRYMLRMRTQSDPAWAQLQMRHQAELPGYRVAKDVASVVRSRSDA